MGEQEDRPVRDDSVSGEAPESVPGQSDESEAASAPRRDVGAGEPLQQPRGATDHGTAEASEEAATGRANERDSKGR